MKYGDPVFSDDFIKLFDHTIKIVDNIIAAVVCVTGVKTNSKFFVECNFVKNPSKFFESAADFGAFSSHGFKRDVAGSIPRQNFIDSFCNLIDSGIYTGANMAPGCRIRVLLRQAALRSNSRAKNCTAISKVSGFTEFPRLMI